MLTILLPRIQLLVFLFYATSLRSHGRRYDYPVLDNLRQCCSVDHNYPCWYATSNPLHKNTIVQGLIYPVILILNIVAVSLYGEAEFWFASLKIIAIIGLIILGIVLFFGGGPNHDRLGFRYWNHPGAFKPYLVENQSTSRFLAFWTAMIKAGFSFIFSPELITTAAGEVESPRRNIPKATNRFIYRLFFFYVLGTLVIGVTVAYNDKSLLKGVASGSSGAGASPFVIGIQNAGIKGLNHVINAAILTSAWSSGNSWVYAGSRTLYSLARDGQAPKFLTRCNKGGVPYASVLVTWAIGLLAYLNVSSSGANVFYWFTNITTVGGFISWVVVMIAYLVSVHGNK